MELDTVIELLERTIKNKALLRAYVKDDVSNPVGPIMIQMVDINLTELNNILDHLKEVDASQKSKST